MSATTYFVTDIEADGPVPAENSMLSFACVAVDDAGNLGDRFEAVMTPLPDRIANPRTMTWWQSQPEAWAAATHKPEAPEVVIPRFVAWLTAHETRRVFAARPAIFDAAWIDAYLWRFAKRRVIDGPFEGCGLFHANGLDIGSLAMGVLGKAGMTDVAFDVPPAWLGHHPHTHRAIDDALGYASALSHLLRELAAR